MEKRPEFTDGIPTLGGALWIDMLNSQLTLDGQFLDFLVSDDSFDKWAKAVSLDLATIETPDREMVRKLRAALLPAFSALAEGNPVPSEALALVNDLLAGRSVRQSLEPQANTYRLHDTVNITATPASTEIAHNFAHFAEAFERERLKHCDNPACSMLFYDRGKNNRRRWCSTSICGNRDKVANFRARKAAADA